MLAMYKCMEDDTPTFLLTSLFFLTSDHRWELPVLRYHKVMVIYPYPFLVVINQFLSWVIFINDRICIFTGSPGSYFLP